MKMKYIFIKTYGGIVDSAATFTEKEAAMSAMKKELIANCDDEYDFYIFREDGAFVTNRKQFSLREEKSSTSMEDLIVAAKGVVACWEGGNLAEAVRDLDEVLRWIEAEND